MRERENNERAPNLNWPKGYQLILRSLCMNESSIFFISIIFIHCPPHMQLVTFQLLFILISIIFINKCAKIPFFLFNNLAIAFSNFINQKQPNGPPLGCHAQHLAWNKCPILSWLLLLSLLHGIFTRDITEWWWLNFPCDLPAAII